MIPTSLAWVIVGLLVGGGQEEFMGSTLSLLVGAASLGRKYLLMLLGLASGSSSSGGGSGW